MKNHPFAPYQILGGLSSIGGLNTKRNGTG